MSSARTTSFEKIQRLKHQTQAHAYTLDRRVIVAPAAFMLATPGEGAGEVQGARARHHALLGAAPRM